MRANYLYASESLSSTGGPRPTRQPLLYQGMSLSRCDYALHKVAPNPDSVSPCRGPLAPARYQSSISRKATIAASAQKSKTSRIGPRNPALPAIPALPARHHLVRSPIIPCRSSTPFTFQRRAAYLILAPYPPSNWRRSLVPSSSHLVTLLSVAIHACCLGCSPITLRMVPPSQLTCGKGGEGMRLKPFRRYHPLVEGRHLRVVSPPQIG